MKRRRKSLRLALDKDRDGAYKRPHAFPELEIDPKSPGDDMDRIAAHANGKTVTKDQVFVDDPRLRMSRWFSGKWEDFAPEEFHLGPPKFVNAGNGYRLCPSLLLTTEVYLLLCHSQMRRRQLRCLKEHANKRLPEMQRQETFLTLKAEKLKSQIHRMREVEFAKPKLWTQKHKERILVVEAEYKRTVTAQIRLNEEEKRLNELIANIKKTLDELHENLDDVLAPAFSGPGLAFPTPPTASMLLGSIYPGLESPSKELEDLGSPITGIEAGNPQTPVDGNEDTKRNSLGLFSPTMVSAQRRKKKEAREQLELCERQYQLVRSEFEIRRDTYQFQFERWAEQQPNDEYFEVLEERFGPIWMHRMQELTRDLQLVEDELVAARYAYEAATCALNDGEGTNDKDDQHDSNDPRNAFQALRRRVKHIRIMQWANNVCDARQDVSSLSLDKTHSQASISPATAPSHIASIESAPYTTSTTGYILERGPKRHRLDENMEPYSESSPTKRRRVQGPRKPRRRRAPNK